jgi:hypothetical protein
MVINIRANSMPKMGTSKFSETPENYLTRTQCHQPGMKQRNRSEILKIIEYEHYTIYAVKSIKQIFLSQERFLLQVAIK